LQTATASLVMYNTSDFVFSYTSKIGITLTLSFHISTFFGDYFYLYLCTEKNAMYLHFY